MLFSVMELMFFLFCCVLKLVERMLLYGFPDLKKTGVYTY